MSRDSYPHDYNDYYTEVLDDIKEYIDDQGQWYIDNNKDFEDLYDDLWTEDSVTGNGSGSYYFNTAKAKEAISEYIWTDSFKDMCDECGLRDGWVFNDGPEAIDVSIRCWMLGDVRGDAQDYFNEKFADQLEEE